MSENATEKKLSPAQLRAVEAMLTSGSTAEAARVAAVNRQTLYRWRKEPAFAEALKEAEAEAVASLSRALVGLGDSATAALRDALAPGQKITVRLRAGDIVITNLLRLRELVDLEQRIAALEAKSNGNN